MNLTIKGLPEEVYERLKKSARSHACSFNAELVQILRDYAAERERIERMRESQDELVDFVASLRPMRDSTRLIRADRRRRP